MAGKIDVNGRKIPDTPIAVDFFRRSHLPSRMLFFLTHAHADHLYGLDSSFDQKIYCTAITKTLLLMLVSIDADLIVEVPYDEPFQIRLPCAEKVNICVTAIDACHCPGAVMFLFEGYFGKILYTGDFRLSPSHLCHELLRSCEPDVLYLDNTYNNPACVFPTRETTQNRILELVASSSDKRTFIALNRIGKEELLVAISKQTSFKIGVSEEQFNKMCKLGLEEICSIDTDDCHITVVPFYSVRTANVDRWMSEMCTQVIVPTARFTGRECTLPKHHSVIVVPHSDHCNYDELLEFVKLVKPVSIQPIVHIKDCLNMNRFDPFLTDRPQVEYVVPQSIALATNTSYNSSFSKRFLVKSKPIVCLVPIRPIRRLKGIEYLSPTVSPIAKDQSVKDSSDKDIVSESSIPVRRNIFPSRLNLDNNSDQPEYSSQDYSPVSDLSEGNGTSAIKDKMCSSTPMKRFYGKRCLDKSNTSNIKLRRIDISPVKLSPNKKTKVVKRKKKIKRNQVVSDKETIVDMSDDEEANTLNSLTIVPSVNPLPSSVIANNRLTCIDTTGIPGNCIAFTNRFYELTRIVALELGDISESDLEALTV